VQVVSEEFSALAAPVSVVNAEKRALGPLVDLAFLGLGLHDVQDDGHSVFIVIPE